MLGYAQGRPMIAARRPSPNALLVVIAAHVTVIALVISAKMDLPARFIDKPLVVDLISEPTPPPREAPVDPQVRPPLQDATVYRPQPTVPTPTGDSQLADSTPVPLPGGELVGPAVPPQPRIDPAPSPAPAPSAARLLTSGEALKPPYPPSKLLSEQEAELRLKLTIAADGRVVAVDPVGPADPVFLAAARRHLIARWRFAPAMEGGRAIASSAVIMLSFRLD